MFEYIFTIGYFNKLHQDHIKLLEHMKKQTEKIIIGLFDDKSIEKIKNISDFDSYDNRKKNLEKYAYHIFMINDINPTKSIQEYITKNITHDFISIKIGNSKTNSKVIKNDYTGNLFFIHEYKDTFTYICENNKIIVTRSDTNRGWGQNLIGYKKNWCFILNNDNNYFEGINYVKSIMPIQSLPYSTNILNKLKEFKKDKVSLMNYLLQTVINILSEHNIPYFLDCGTLLGCIRENGLMKKDTDVDVTTHLSFWDKLNSINFDKYGLTRKRTFEKKSGYLISVKFNNIDMYCDIYSNPAFPQLEIKNMNGKDYFVPKNSDLYLTQLYGNWKIPSNIHANWPKFFYNKLIKSPYSKYWDLDFEIKIHPRPLLNEKFK